MYKVTIKTKVVDGPSRDAIVEHIMPLGSGILFDIFNKAELPIVIPGKVTKDEALETVAILSRGGAKAEIIKVDDRPENAYGDIMSYSVKINMLMPIRDRAIEAMKKVLKIEFYEARRMALYTDSTVLVDGFTLEAANSLADELIANGACIEISEGTAQQPVMVYQANTIRKYCPQVSKSDAILWTFLWISPLFAYLLCTTPRPETFRVYLGITIIFMLGWFRGYVMGRKIRNTPKADIFIFSLILLAINNMLTLATGASVLAISLGLGAISPRAVHPKVDQFPYVIGVILLTIGTYGLLGWQMAAAVAIGSSIVSVLLRRNRKRALLKSAADPKYTVVLKSQGESMGDTIRQLRSVIPVKPYEAERIIRTVPVTLLDGVDAVTAKQTRQALEKAGAVVEVMESTTLQPMMVYTNQGLESAIDTIQSKFVRWTLKWVN